MTPTEEARFIQLWQEGASYATIAQALGIPAGTVSRRASALQVAGKIARRPRGGAYPRQQAQGRHAKASDPGPAQAPGTAPAAAPV